MILYIHGFAGSPEGRTVQLLTKHMDIRVEGLSYDPCDPKAAIENLKKQYWHYEQFLGENFDNDQMVIMGSSLGGFFAAQVAAEVGCKLVLFNPALNPVETMAKYQDEESFKQQYVERYKPYCGSAIEETFETIRRNDFRVLLFTTDDPIIDNRLAPELSKGFNHHVHFAEDKQHRLSENTLLKMKDDIQEYYQALWGETNE